MDLRLRDSFLCVGQLLHHAQPRHSVSTGELQTRRWRLSEKAAFRTQVVLGKICDLLLSLRAISHADSTKCGYVCVY